ncbi:solute carrier family 35 member C2-like isoform X2 [Varroa jacobsoni]|uniref:Sugar phosphate transporter domain-containing protein n=1 Tax=Varroa destructor TaxID=109461 RepID=A0A7M7KXB0_VARDE|nr:solute carrier family 35 member C2-like isoform X2 [Varroa destructor]XP_022695091.1 solute carrier family 35 member C2-like isoform X2 [Varroa jacobsoni]
MRISSGTMTLRLRHPSPPVSITTILSSISTKYLWVSVRTIALVLLYYSFSIGITFYQKWFIKEFHFPLIVVTCHLVVKFILSWLCRVVYTLFTRRTRVLLPWNVYVRHLAVTGVASALDIGFSNWSFEFITISLYTMTKSTCIIFILAFSLSFGLEQRRPSLIAVVSLIGMGLFLFTYQSTQFNLEGFLLVLSASALAGLRWTLAQLVMQRKELGLGNPVDMMYHIQPWMILGLLPLAIAFEGPRLATSEKIFRFHPEQEDVLLTNVLRIIGGSVIAFLMEVSEYLLLSYTSSLTLSIAGILKETFTLYLAVVYSGDILSPLNMVGLVICLTGISLHIVYKSIHQTNERLPLLPDSRNTDKLL